MQRKESLKEHVVKDGFFDGSNKQKGKNLAMERVKIIDCSAYCGPLVMKYPMLRRLWLVKDICGLVSYTDASATQMHRLHRYTGYRC